VSGGGNKTLSALNDKITGEINLLAGNLFSGADARKNVEPLNRPKALLMNYTRFFPTPRLWSRHNERRVERQGRKAGG
jgi:hypothetical protein